MVKLTYLYSVSMRDGGKTYKTVEGVVESEKDGILSVRRKDGSLLRVCRSNIK